MHKENLRLGGAIAHKKREEKAKAKLAEMVDNNRMHMLEPVKEEVKKAPPVNLPVLIRHWKRVKRAKSPHPVRTFTPYCPLKNQKGGEHLPV